MKLEQAELMKVIEEETPIPEEPERRLKRLWLRHQEGPSGTGSSSNSNVTPLKMPKLEIDDLPYATLLSQARAMALTGEPASAQAEDTDKGKQPVLANTFLGDVEKSQSNVRNESGSGASLCPTHRRDKGKEPILTQSGCRETMSGSEGVPFKEPEPKHTDISLIKPKDGPGAETTPLEVPLSVIRPESLTNGGSSNEIDLPQEADQPQSADNENSSNKIHVMRKIEKPRVCNDDSYFRYLPNEVILLILNKLIDLKTLCRCKLVSTLFNLIVHQVDTISFVASRADNPSYNSNPSSDARLPNPFYFPGPMVDVPSERGVPPASYECESFRSAMQSMSKFTRLKSLCIELPSTRQDVDDGSDLYKWKVKFGSKIESLVFLSTNSVCDMKGLSNVNGNGQGREQYHLDLSYKKVHLAFDCLRDAAVRFWMLLGCIINFPSLEKVLITQSGKRGSVSISGKDIVEMRKWLSSPTDSLEQKLSDSMDLPSKRTRFCVPLLKLPVSGYVMKGVTLVMFQRKDLRDGDDSFMNINLNDFEDKEEAAYGEAVMEMLKIRSKIPRA